jgi:hypothetical protein
MKKNANFRALISFCKIYGVANNPKKDALTIEILTKLQTTTIQTKLDSLETSNTDLINGYTNLCNTIINRNTTLFNPLTGLVQTALEVKKYVESDFGASSPQFKQLSPLEFANVKDR